VPSSLASGVDPAFAAVRLKRERLARPGAEGFP
jgi:hypothetical protein